MIEENGKGVIVYMNQEGRGIGLLNKLKHMNYKKKVKIQLKLNIELGFKPDLRDYGIEAQILKHMNVTKINLLSNNPKKRTGIKGY